MNGKARNNLDLYGYEVISSEAAAKMQFLSADRLKNLLEDTESQLELLSNEVSKITKEKAGQSVKRRTETSGKDPQRLRELVNLLSQIESEEVRCSLLLLASARFSLDCFPIEDSSDRADLVTISDGLKKFYKRSIADHLANRFQSDSTTSAVLGHQLKLFTLLTSTDESWALYRKEIAKQLRRQFDGKSLSELGDLKKELERQMTNDFQLLVSNGFEIDLGPSEALNLVYLDQIKEILQMKIPPIEGPAKKQLVNEILLVIKFANDIEEISEKLHKQLIFKDETSTTPGLLIPTVDTTKISSTSKLPLLTVNTSLVGIKQNQAIDTEKSFDVMSIVSDMSVEPLHVVDKTKFFQRPLWEWRSVFSSIGDEMIAQFKTDVVTALEGFELEINCKSVPTENFDKFAVVKGTVNIAKLIGLTDTLCKCYGTARLKSILETFEQWLNRFHTYIATSTEETWQLKVRHLVLSTFSQLLIISNGYKSFSGIQSLFNTALQLLIKGLTELHVNRLHFYVINDGGNSNLYSDHKCFWENESLSFSIRMWSFYLKNVWDDLLEICITVHLKQKIFSTLLLQSLTYFLNRFATTNVSVARTEQLRNDMRFMLASTNEFLYRCSRGLADVLGLSCEKIQFESCDTEVIRENIRNVHKTCRDILCCLAIKTSPFDVLYKVYKKGYEVAVEKAKNSSEIVNVWIRMINPLMFPSEFGSLFDLETVTAVTVQLKLYLNQPDSDWTLLLQLLYVKNYSFTSLLLILIDQRSSDNQNFDMLAAILWIFSHSGISASALNKIVEPLVEK